MITVATPPLPTCGRLGRVQRAVATTTAAWTEMPETDEQRLAGSPTTAPLVIPSRWPTTASRRGVLGFSASATPHRRSGRATTASTSTRSTCEAPRPGHRRRRRRARSSVADGDWTRPGSSVRPTGPVEIVGSPPTRPTSSRSTGAGRGDAGPAAGSASPCRRRPSRSSAIDEFRPVRPGLHPDGHVRPDPRRRRRSRFWHLVDPELRGGRPRRRGRRPPVRRRRGRAGRAHRRRRRADRRPRRRDDRVVVGQSMGGLHGAAVCERVPVACSCWWRR